MEIKLASWFDSILALKQPEPSLSAYRFGISETDDGYSIYLADSKIYDEESDDWASVIPDFMVDELEIQQEEVRQWYFMLIGLLSFLGKELRKPTVQNSFLGNKPVYVGFNDGDLIRLQ